MEGDSVQTVLELSETDLKSLARQRATIERFLADQQSKQNYQSVAGKLGLIRSLLLADKFKPEQTYELQCLGVVLGDALVQEMKMKWVLVEDQFGRDPAVKVPQKEIFLFPLTMISKRVEAAESVDVFAMFNKVIEQVEQLQK